MTPSRLFQRLEQVGEVLAGELRAGGPAFQQGVGEGLLAALEGGDLFFHGVFRQ